MSNQRNLRLGLPVWLAVAGVALNTAIAAEPLVIPGGGRAVLAAEPLAGAGLKGEGVERRLVAVEHPEFQQALEVRTTRRAERDYDIELSFPSAIALAKDEALLVSFWVRTLASSDESGCGVLRTYFQRNAPNWEKSLNQSFTCGDQWRRFLFPMRLTHCGYGAGEAALCFAIGNYPQTLQFAGVQVLTYGATRAVSELPQTIISFDYIGRDPAAPWRRAAAERIERLRKGDLTIRVTDDQGAPVAGAEVRVRMTRQAYAFGSAVTAYDLTRTGEDGERYRRIVADHFNKVVFENDLKHQPWRLGLKAKPEDGGWNHHRLFAAFRWLAEHKIPIRGHTLTWGPIAQGIGYRHPPEIDFNDVAGAKAAILRHHQEILERTREFVGEWDVINHPVATFGDQGDRLDRRFGPGYYAEVIRQVRSLRPDLVAYVNEGAVMAGRACRETYAACIADLIRQDAAPGGLGFMCHFSNGEMSGIDEIWATLERYARFNLPLLATEFDIDTADEEGQAAFMRDFLTLWFSHPRTVGIIMWGFWEGRHWRPRASLWAKDWRLKPCGQAWLDLVTRKWMTDLRVRTDALGQARVRCFLGDYRLTATGQGRTASATGSLPPGGTEVGLILTPTPGGAGQP